MRPASPPATSSASTAARPWHGEPDPLDLTLLEEVFATAETGGDVHDPGQLPPRRRVRGEEAGEAAEDQHALLRADGPGVVLADRGLEHLVPVELGVLGEQGAAEEGDELRRVAAAAQEPGRDRTREVDTALDVPA